MKKREDFDLSPLLTFPSIEGVLAAVIIDVRRSKEDGLYPIKFRVTYQRKRVYFPCMDVTLDEYEKLHRPIRGGSLLKTKKLIQAGFQRLTDTIEDIVVHEGFSMEKLNRRLSKGVADSVLSSFENKVAGLREKGKIGTAVWYECAKNSIERYAKKDVMFSDVTPSWLEKYEKHLLKEGKKYTTVSINVRALRSIINDGKAAGVISEAQYPFERSNDGKYSIPEGSGRKIALNAEQLMAVFDHPIPPEDDRWRDLFVFSFYCNGTNISDILRLKYENITGGYIEWFRGKTISQDKKKIKIRAAITEEMEEIIHKYGNHDKRPSNYIFPYLKPGMSPVDERKVIQDVTHTINKKMRKIGQALGIGNITTYWARHTFASISRREGVSLFGISKSLGHKNLATTQIYLDSLSDEEINENAAKLPRRRNHE